MFEHAMSALSDLFEPMRLLVLFGGMLVGMVFGMLPGLGGVAAVSILLPFIYYLDDYSGLAMLLGAVSIVYTSDTITSVLLGAPGSPASAPTAIEGYALAKKGRAARALGVGFLASMVGGLVGATVLFVAIPVAGPIVLLLSTPELFMFAVVGLVFASSMIGENLAKGLAAACLGLFLGAVGPAQAAADFRFTFGQVYLLDGFSLTIVALGMFGVAEVITMLSVGGGISGEAMKVAGWKDGFRDFWVNKWLVIRSAIIGVFGGFVPAVGASASTWVAYGHAIRSTKDKSQFGKGEIRGIAAAEGANNATVISDLVPTVLFSVPGGPAAAIFLGALFSFGYYPGPRMITEHPDLMFLMVWSVALTSVVGAAICFAISPALAKLTRIPFGIIAAPLILIMVIGAYQSTSTMGDIFMLFALGALGWVMKHADWPRAPALVGFVLAKPMEQYFWLTNQIHGWSWVTRPGVLIIASVIIIPLVLGGIRKYRARKDAVPVADANAEKAMGGGHNHSVGLFMAVLASFAFVYGAWEMMGFNPASRLFPSLAIGPGIGLSLWLVYRGLREYRPDLGRDASELTILAALIFYGVAVWAIGITVPTALLLAWMLLIRAKMRLWTGLIYGTVIFVFIQVLFGLLRGDAPIGALFNIG
ncbi:tripartite tricarboxylate transporter permease [Paracoccus sp. Z330]|uniref:Tripartite tricarboxylate transporter permease n=1 Tax=Paracoccus onchidii TaxID=3017813 RepID=A0ABT4ZJU9_9RHOB|nr:tripartite tricarboxylate transporter permease [Paracoccus onchidii]MDB6179647.1 tripartite tricarboxylate transporter permease [Paracoccus onchidii]